MYKKIILWVVTLFILFSGGIITYIYYNQDIIKNRLITALNSRLQVPVDIQGISISALSTFPDAGVIFQKVRIADPYIDSGHLLIANEVSFSFSIWDMINGSMVLEEISMRGGEIHIVQYAADKWSYQIYKDAPESSNNGNFSVDIKKVKLADIKAFYSSEVSNTYWDGIISDSEASVKVQGPVTWINTSSSISSNVLRINNFETLQNQLVQTNAELIFDKNWSIKTTLLKIGDSFFNIKVNKDDRLISGSFSAEDANVQTLLSLTPEQYKKRLSNYTSTGKISLNCNVNYTLASGKTALSGNLEFNEVNIVQQQPAINLSALNLKGAVAIPDLEKLSTASLSLSGIHGKMNGEKMTAGFQMTNFDDPYVKASYKGDMPLAFLKDLSGMAIKEPSGDLIIDLQVEGDLASFSESLKTVRTSGEIIARDLKFLLPNRSYLVEVPVGIALFTNEHLAINDLELIMGNSQFRINGQLMKFWNITSTEKSWSASAEVQSESLMLDELLSIEDANPDAEVYAFHIPANINLDLKATVDKFQVRQFKAHRISGNIIVKNKVLQADRLSFEAMGGLVKLKGEWRDLQKDGSDINASFLLAGINADSLFSSFENFNQEFITDKNLSGEIYAESETSLRLDSNLVFLPASLNATLKTRIINGELKDFQPLYSLEKYLDHADLSAVKFAELENQIYIQNQTIHLPMMAIGTNIIKFKIGGKHTFDQHIDYDVVAPLKRKKRTDKDERFGTVADDQHGESLLFLSIIGTTSSFEVSLDKQAIKTEIAADVKREIQELQDAFKNNGKTTSREVELEEDDYFDWEN